MKQLTTIGVVVLLLFGAAIYYSTAQRDATPEPTATTKPPVEPERDPSPVTSVSADGTLRVEAAISNGYLLGEGSHDLYAAVDVTAVEHKSANRPPLNVAVVIDRSGSMAGQKIEYAKIAARRLVNVLSENDRVAIVSYGSDVTVDFPSRPVTQTARMDLLRVINDIAVGGGTNLSGGFQRGYSQVSKWKNAETINRVILMSDGHANIGITNPNKLRALASNSLSNNVSVSTIGVGLDYNEDLMTNMANVGAGNYYFVDQPDSIVSMFESELEGLASTVARNTALVLELAPGVSLAKLHGYPHQVSGNRVHVSLAEFFGKQAKNVLLELRVDGARLTDEPVLEVKLSYDDLVSEKPAHHALALEAVVTDDPKKAEQLVDADVISRVQQVEVATSMQEAMELWDRGDSDRATEVIERTKSTMQKRRSKYKFKKAEAYDRTERELDQMVNEIQAKPASTPEGKRYIKSKKARSNSIILNEASF